MRIGEAVSVGRSFQSSNTGFIHLHDTIPIFENFCFAFALFRQKTGDSVREGKELIKRLLAFQLSDGNFPRYLHEYPEGRDAHLALKIAPILHHIMEDFSTVLEDSYKEMLKMASLKMIQPPKGAHYHYRYQALMGKRGEKPLLKTAKEWFEWIISDQLFEKNGVYPIPFNQAIQIFTGTESNQDQFEPVVSPIEYILGEGKRYDKETLAKLYASLLYPFTTSNHDASFFTWTEDLRFLWRPNHSLVAPNATLMGDHLIFNLEGEGSDAVEACIYTNLSDEKIILINGKKGTVFYLGDTISISTPGLNVDLEFSGQGEFCGHISRGNRPGQIALKGDDMYRAFDWQIALRTLKRKSSTKVFCKLQYKC